jgi:hypothetical protein
LKSFEHGRLLMRIDVAMVVRSDLISARFVVLHAVRRRRSLARFFFLFLQQLKRFRARRVERFSPAKSGLRSRSCLLVQRFLRTFSEKNSSVVFANRSSYLLGIQGKRAVILQMRDGHGCRIFFSVGE